MFFQLYFILAFEVSS